MSAEQPDDVPGESEAGANEIRARTDAATVLVHTLMGDSWGIQEVILRERTTGALQMFPLFWQAGHLLRSYLSSAERERLIGRLRLEIVTQAVADGATGD
jgi:hypothetical protein